MKTKLVASSPQPTSYGATGHRFAAAGAVLIVSAALSQAEIIKFDLSPLGSDAAVGLSPANEFPQVLTSTGSGNEISGGITFDTESSILSIAMGYGSAAGFTNLTGAATSMHIHGPAVAGQNALPIVDLLPIHFPAGDSTTGGVFFGSVAFLPAQAADLLAGLNYVNIHTLTNSNGEIRGQLVPVTNTAPELVCPGNATLECGVPFTFTTNVFDADGDAVEVVWSLNGEPVQMDEIAAGATAATDVEYTAALPLGVNQLAVTATDSAGNVSNCSSTITIEDTTPPVIVSASVNPKQIWPPNHKMVPVLVSAEATDTCGEATWSIVSISSNQAVDMKGSGNTAPDWQITGDATANVRAERSGTNKGGRVYTITLEATDGSGNVSEPATVTVTVPHSMGKSPKSKK